MKKLLVVVDYQNDFVSGSLGFPGAELLESGIVDKIQEYIKNEDDVVFTMDCHGEDYLSTREGKNLPVPHCIKGTEGYLPYGKTAEYHTGRPVFDKSSFGSAELFDFVRQQSYGSIELCGLVSNICVLSNAVLCKAAQPEAEIIVDSELTASHDRQLNEKTLDVLKSIQVTVV